MKTFVDTELKGRKDINMMVKEDVVLTVKGLMELALGSQPTTQGASIDRLRHLNKLLDHIDGCNGMISLELDDYEVVKGAIDKIAPTAFGIHAPFVLDGFDAAEIDG